MRVLVTGATGFVGRTFVPTLQSAGHEVRGASRANGPALDDVEADWRSLLEGCDAVVHLAAMVHVMKDPSALADRFRTVNVNGTARLAGQAAEGGVRRFLLLSSVKVHGDAGHMSESSPRAPLDPYGRSKRDAEDAVVEIAARTGIEVVIVRPPLIYGPGVRANFAALASAVKRGIPLPLGAIHNRRSLVGLRNLSSLLSTCLDHPNAANEVFMVSDGDDLSTPELIRRMASALGRQPRLFPMSESSLKGIGWLIGRGAEVDRLVGSLTVDISKARKLLSWNPPEAVDAELREALQ